MYKVYLGENGQFFWYLCYSRMGYGKSLNKVMQSGMVMREFENLEVRKINQMGMDKVDESQEFIVNLFRDRFFIC